ncbi:MAG TPA: helix-turn-helix domain-containing protein [Kofleriaceae bacterium]|nr:helix-turn-helix domain-containing protein [Kofleriaceae bacterium]
MVNLSKKAKTQRVAATADKLDTKQKILAAAETEFMTRGYDGSRMQAIADRAGLNKAMLHYHFRSKDELFEQIFRDKASLLFPKAHEGLRAHTNFIEFTCGFVDMYLALLNQHPYLPFYMLQVATANAVLFSQVAADFPVKFVRAFTAAAKAGQIRDHDPQQFLLSLVGMCMWPFIGKNMIQHNLGLSDAVFATLLEQRAAEVKRYVVLLLTPEARAATRKKS